MSTINIEQVSQKEVEQLAQAFINTNTQVETIQRLDWRGWRIWAQIAHVRTPDMPTKQAVIDLVGQFEVLQDLWQNWFDFLPAHTATNAPVAQWTLANVRGLVNSQIDENTFYVFTAEIAQGIRTQCCGGHNEGTLSDGSCAVCGVTL